MKSKRLTTLIAIFVISLLACAATFGITAWADETDETGFSSYFTYENVDVSVEGDALRLTLKDETATVKSKYDFYLGALKIKFEGTDAGIVVNDTAYTSDDVIGEGSGKLEFTVKDGAADGYGSILVKGFYYNEDTSAPNYLYAIDANVIAPVAENAYVGDIRFGEKVILGYKYESVTVPAYHGFVEKLAKKYAIEFDETSALPTEQAEVFASATNYKFKSNADAVAKIFWGTVKEGEEGAADTWLAYASKNVEITTELPSEDSAPAYNSKLSSFVDGSATNNIVKYQELINAQLKEGNEWKYTSSSEYFVVPVAIYDYIESKYFTGDDLTKIIYYKLPESNSFTKLSSTSTTKRFALTKVGEYEYYVLASDPLNNTLEIGEDWVLTSVNGVKGYYYNEAEKDNENYKFVIGDLQVPVFTFYLGNRGPQVKRSSSSLANGYINVSYTKISTFTTQGNDLTTNYSLYYAESGNYSVDNEYDATVAAEIAAEGSKWTEISTEEGFAAAFGSEYDFADLGWNSTSLNFTPVKAGVYVVKCSVVDATAANSETFSAPVTVKVGIQKADLQVVRVWFQENWMSVLFLGIAVVSLIGIVVLLFVKPKEEKEIEEIAKK